MHRGGRIGGRIRKMAAATECNSNRGVGVPHHSPAKMKKGSSSIKPENPAPSLNCGSARTTIELWQHWTFISGLVVTAQQY